MQQRCKPMTSVSSKIRFMRIFAGLPGEGPSDDSWVVENSTFARYFVLKKL